MKKLKFQTKLLKLLNPNFFPSSIFETLDTMSSPSSPTLDKVIEKIMEDMQGERVEGEFKESLDLCNSNLRNMYNAQGEFKGTLSLW